VRTYAEIDADAKDSPAFSNATEADIFQHNVCRGCSWYEDVEPEQPWDCPILDVTLMGKWPIELVGAVHVRECTARETGPERRAREKRELREYIDGLHEPLFDLGDAS
jgi:hypothetical protein